MADQAAADGSPLPALPDGEPLTHATKARPKRGSVRAPSRELLRAHSCAEPAAAAAAAAAQAEEAAPEAGIARSLSAGTEAHAEAVARASPLQRFSMAKQEIGAIFEEFQQLLGEVDAFVGAPPRWVEHAETGESIVHSETLTVAERKRLGDMLAKITGIATMVSRDNMKVRAGTPGGMRRRSGERSCGRGGRSRGSRAENKNKKKTMTTTTTTMTTGEEVASGRALTTARGMLLIYGLVFSLGCRWCSSATRATARARQSTRCWARTSCRPGM